MSLPDFLVIADPNSKRWQAYERELELFWGERSQAPTIRVLPWRDVIQSDGDLSNLVDDDRSAIVRIESPARDFEVTRCLLLAGERAKGGDDSVNCSSVPYEKGRLVSPGLAYQGWRHVLSGLQQSLDARPQLQPLAQPNQIAEMFDKNATCSRLKRHEIPCPNSIDPPLDVDALLEELLVRQWPVAYVKLATGSSASGIAVVRAMDHPPTAITSMVQIDDKFFNTRRLKHVEGQQLRDTLEFILQQGACVQKGIPMAQIQGQNYDVRVVMIYGEPAFTIFRLSSEPMTNLHLGGRRGDPEMCRAAIPTRAWLDAMDHCVDAADLYDSAVMGIDLVFERGYMRHYILEINAFGDFLPGWTNEQGKTVHRYEIEKTAERMS